MFYAGQAGGALALSARAWCVVLLNGLSGGGVQPATRLIHWLLLPSDAPHLDMDNISWQDCAKLDGAFAGKHGQTKGHLDGSSKYLMGSRQ